MSKFLFFRLRQYHPQWVSRHRNSSYFRNTSRYWLALCGVVLASFFIVNQGKLQANPGEEVNVYSYRAPYLINPIFKQFEQQTGLKVNVLHASSGLIERLKAEGENSPADVLLTVDIGRLEQAKKAGLGAKVHSKVLFANIPAKYRDADNQWFGLSLRARIIFASKERVKTNEISYEQLADRKWKKRICTRSGQHVYSIGLFAAMIAHHGEAWTRNWLDGVKNNLAQAPSGNDRSQIKAIYSGMCDLALANTYYLAKMLTDEQEPAQRVWAQSVKPIFPDAKGVGTHVNVSGIILLANAPHPKNALKLMEFLSSDQAQKLYGEVNYEYPVKPGVAVSKLVSSWGMLHPDKLSLSQVANYRAKASELVDEVGFDSGP